MKRIIYFLMAAIAICGCQKFDECDIIDNNVSDNEIVEVLDDGSLRIALNLKSANMDDISISTRGGSDYETTIKSGWCLVYGEEEAHQNDEEKVFTDNSPLIQKVPVVVNANGDFFVTLEPYEHTSFIRFVANLTDREQKSLESKESWFDVKGSVDTEPTYEDVTNYGIGTYGGYRLQSVGLDGIYKMTYNTGLSFETNQKGELEANYSYENKNKPNPALENIADCFPMASPGFVLSNISTESIEASFGIVIYLIRTCAKMQIDTNDSGFKLMKIYMKDCAQESRIRSTLYKESGTSSTEVNKEVFDIPVDLGGTIDYEPLVVNDKNITDTDWATESTPIYFYPNSGGNYESEAGAVDKDVNPQYVIFKGRAPGYDTNGYYKIALKGRYPLAYEFTDGVRGDVTEWSDVTYDVWRNISYKIKLLNVNNPGYKRYKDAADKNNPASNISYNISITSTENGGRNEILLSNGTFFVDLESSFIFMKGYGTEGTYSSTTFTLKPNSDHENYQYPTTYIMSDSKVEVIRVKTENGDVISQTIPDDAKADSDNIADKWYVIPSAKKETKVTVYFKATGSGHVRLRIGDILKFISVKYDPEMVSRESWPDTSDNIPTTNSPRYFYIWDESDGEKGDKKGTMSNMFMHPQGKCIELKLDNNNYEVESTEYMTDDPNFFTDAGQIRDNNSGEIKEFRAMFCPNMGSNGIVKLYFKQSTEFTDYNPANW